MTQQQSALAGPASTTAERPFDEMRAIFQAGLHEFLTDVIERTAVLGSDISAFYLMS